MLYTYTWIKISIFIVVYHIFKNKLYTFVLEIYRNKENILVVLYNAILYTFFYKLDVVRRKIIQINWAKVLNFFRD